LSPAFRVPEGAMVGPSNSGICPISWIDEALMGTPNFSVRSHRLLADGKPVESRSSPNVGGACSRRFLVMHFTSGGFEGAVSWLCQAEAKVSAHLVIADDGRVVQLVPFDRAAWHAGPSQWRGCTSMNSSSIGIELANWGDMIEGGPGAYHVGKTLVPDARVLVARHKNGGPMTPWHRYTDVQLATALAVAKALEAAYGFEDVCGHEDIAPNRKVDPGPAFPLASFRASVLGAPARPVAPQETIPAPTGANRSPEALQAALNLLGARLDVDGDVGPETRAAVRSFQIAHGLDDDGIAGSDTWTAIDVALATHKN